MTRENALLYSTILTNLLFIARLIEEGTIGDGLRQLRSVARATHTRYVEFAIWAYVNVTTVRLLSEQDADETERKVSMLEETIVHEALEFFAEGH